MENVIILDVEGMSVSKPYNIGYIVADLMGNIIKSVSVALPVTFWHNLKNCYHASEMTTNNIKEILADFGNENNKYDYITTENFISNFENDIKFYNVNEIWAYNVTFDKNAIKRLYDEKSLPDVQWSDIWSAVFYACCNNKTYVDFCLNNNFLTNKGNIKTSAEVTYSFMTNNLTFSEEHTGLADCKIEYELLLWALSKNQTLVKKNTTPPYKVLKRFTESWE